MQARPLNLKEGEESKANEESLVHLLMFLKGQTLDLSAKGQGSSRALGSASSPH